jgi:hypothetical protein
MEVIVCGGGFANGITEYLHQFLGNLSTKYSMVDVVEIVEVSNLFYLAMQEE